MMQEILLSVRERREQGQRDLSTWCDSTPGNDVWDLIFDRNVNQPENDRVTNIKERA